MEPEREGKFNIFFQLQPTVDIQMDRSGRDFTQHGKSFSARFPDGLFYINDRPTYKRYNYNLPELSI